jgi:hypothetical protein
VATPCPPAAWQHHTKALLELADREGVQFLGADYDEVLLPLSAVRRITEAADIQVASLQHAGAPISPGGAF